MIKVGSERFEAPECMFQPDLIDVEQPGMAGELVLSFALSSVYSSTLTASLMLRITLQHRTSCPCRCQVGVVQAYRSFGWFEYVPWIAKSIGEGDQTALS